MSATVTLPTASELLQQAVRNRLPRERVHAAVLTLCREALSIVASLYPDERELAQGVVNWLAREVQPSTESRTYAARSQAMLLPSDVPAPSFFHHAEHENMRQIGVRLDSLAWARRRAGVFSDAHALLALYWATVDLDGWMYASTIAIEVARACAWSDARDISEIGAWIAEHDARLATLIAPLLSGSAPVQFPDQLSGVASRSGAAVVV